MSTQAPGNVPEDDVTVIELDREGCARKDLLNAADYLERGFFDVLRGAGRAGLRHAHAVSVFSIANSDE